MSLFISHVLRNKYLSLLTLWDYPIRMLILMLMCRLVLLLLNYRFFPLPSGNRSRRNRTSRTENSVLESVIAPPSNRLSEEVYHRKCRLFGMIYVAMGDKCHHAVRNVLATGDPRAVFRCLQIFYEDKSQENISSSSFGLIILFMMIVR